MKIKFLSACVLLGMYAISQTPATSSLIDPLSYGVILDDPATKKVTSKLDITYLQDGKGSLKLDLYLPPGLTSTDKRPAIVFLNAIGERPNDWKVKSWGIYTSWPKLMAANGYIGISMETDGARIQESIQGLFNFLSANGDRYNIDKNSLGVYAASANVTQSVVYLMSDKVDRGIKAAVLYYGNTPSGPFRKDLPVFFMVSEGDATPGRYNALWNEVLKNNAPWTIKMGTGMPHAFDAYSDNDVARKIVKETISFWKNNLDPVPQPSWAYSKGRDVLGSSQMNPKRALELLKTMSEENPGDVRVLGFYATTLRHEQQNAEAAIAYKKVLALEPGNVDALVNLAAFSYIDNRKAEAETYVSKAITTGKMNRDGYAQLGYVLIVANKNAESAQYYEKAVAMEPRGLDYYNLACAYAKDNVKDKAIAALENAIKYGYDSKQQFEHDNDLDSLRSDERFKKMLSSLK